MPIGIIKGLAVLKKAAAKVNMETNGLDPKIGNTIMQVADEVRTLHPNEFL